MLAACEHRHSPDHLTLAKVVEVRLDCTLGLVFDGHNPGFVSLLAVDYANAFSKLRVRAVKVTDLGWLLERSEWLVSAVQLDHLGSLVLLPPLLSLLVVVSY